MFFSIVLPPKQLWSHFLLCGTQVWAAPTATSAAATATATFGIPVGTVQYRGLLVGTGCRDLPSDCQQIRPSGTVQCHLSRVQHDRQDGRCGRRVIILVTTERRDLAQATPVPWLCHARSRLRPTARFNRSQDNRRPAQPHSLCQRWKPSARPPSIRRYETSF